MRPVAQPYKISCTNFPSELCKTKGSHKRIRNILIKTSSPNIDFPNFYIYIVANKFFGELSKNMSSSVAHRKRITSP